MCLRVLSLKQVVVELVAKEFKNMTQGAIFPLILWHTVTETAREQEKLRPHTLQ